MSRPLEPQSCARVTVKESLEMAYWMRDIIDETASEFGVTRADILAPTRGKAKVILARQKAMWRVRHELNASYLRMALVFKRDHSTIIYNVKCHEAERHGKRYIKPRNVTSSGSDRGIARAEMMC